MISKPKLDPNYRPSKPLYKGNACRLSYWGFSRGMDRWAAMLPKKILRLKRYESLSGW